MPLLKGSFACELLTVVQASANLLGRLFWGQLSDTIGRKACFNAIGIAGFGSVMAVPAILHHLQEQVAVGAATSLVPLYV